MELEVLRKDMVAAMKAKDKVTKEAVSSLISAVKKVAIDEGCRDEIKSDLVDRVILKELKTVKEQLDTCPAVSYTHLMRIMHWWEPKATVMKEKTAMSIF